MKFSTDTGLILVALAILVVLLVTYSKRKSTNMLSSLGQTATSYSVPSPSRPLGQNELYGTANGIQTSNYGHGKKQVMDDPSALLPNDVNSKWSNMNPQGDGYLKSINLLQSGSLIGINTVSSSMRNANLQLRSEPANPQSVVGPWNNSTILPDNVRQPLEIGCQA
jgi:hypothetical protein